MNRIKKTITLPSELIKWANKAISEGRYAGIRSFSALVEYLLMREIEKIERIQRGREERA